MPTFNFMLESSGTRAKIWSEKQLSLLRIFCVATPRNSRKMPFSTSKLLLWVSIHYSLSRLYCVS